MIGGSCSKEYKRMVTQRLFYSHQVVLFVQNLRVGLLRTLLSWGSAREGTAPSAGAARTRISKNCLVGVKITWGLVCHPDRDGRGFRLNQIMLL